MNTHTKTETFPTKKIDNRQKHHQDDPVLMRLGVWTGIALVIMTAIGFGVFMGYIDPPSPALSAESLLERIQRQQTPILVGAAICTFFWSFWVTWAAPILIYIRRMERTPLLTYASLANVGGGAAIITSIAVSFTVMAFRAENALVVQAFNDFGFFLFLYTWPPFGIWMAIIALAIFRDINPVPTFPRWVAFYNLWAAFMMAPASLMGLFKIGPFAYDGILAFWLVAVDFFIWMLVMSWVVLRKISEDEYR